MHDSAFNRRTFLVAAIAVGGAAAGLRAGRAWAQGREADADVRSALAAMAHRLYPHAVPAAVYAEIMAAASEAAANDPALATALAEAEAALDAGQPGRFLALDEQAQIEALRAVEQAGFFGVILAAVRARVYDHRAVWALLGYEGPSYQQGGYLNRGAGRIDWLPEGR